MDKTILSQVNAENAEVICAKIREETDSEVNAILGRAQSQAQQILQEARAQAAQERETQMAILEKDLEKTREKAHSSLSLEKKRFTLEGKNTVVLSVLDLVKHTADDFRRSAGYGDFLQKAIVEGAQVIEQQDLEIRFSYKDERLFDEKFIAQVNAACAAVVSGGCSLRLRKEEFGDIGVIVSSQDGRMMFDNRFTARLERMYESIYMDLLREA
jgi:vacuolar-type H+-ATPase subunit E/Vma4